jgi:hydrogenase expression/formation protein HypD
MASGGKELILAGDIELARDLIHKIRIIALQIPYPITLMHICGTHEYTIVKNGLRSLFPPNLKVIPGPGCPVCVCSANEIDAAIAIAQKPNTILTSFGDMLRVPASTSSLEEIRARGADVRIVYGPNEAVTLAKKQPKKEVIFFAIGFETTAPLIGYELCSNPPPNFSVISAHKLVPPAFDLLLGVEKLQIDGFLLPGHVSAIIGANIYNPNAEKYHVPMVIGGFEINDVLSSILLLLRQILSKTATIENNYTRVVKPEGNPIALKVMKEAFVIDDTIWL